MAVISPGIASRFGIDCSYGKCTMQAIPFQPWPYIFLLTTDALLHVRGFRSADLVGLHVESLHDLVSHQWTTELDTQGPLDSESALCLDATQILLQLLAQSLQIANLRVVAALDLIHLEYCSALMSRVAPLAHLHGFSVSSTEVVDNGAPLTLLTLDTLGSLDHDTSPPSAAEEQAVPTPYWVIGERNSGTSWLEALIQDNAPPDILLRGDGFWKHGLVPSESLPPPWAASQRTTIILSVKCPLAWAVSMFKNPFHTVATNGRPRSFAEFLVSPWQASHQDSQNTSWVEAYNTVGALRTAKLKNHLGLRNRVPHFFLLRYEDLLSDPEEQVKKIFGLLGVHTSRSYFLASSRAFRGSGSLGSPQDTFTPARRAYYMERQYFAEYDPPSIEAYMGQLDKVTEAEAGYDLESIQVDALRVAGGTGGR